MSYFLFLLVNAVLFCRPAEIFDELQELPIYEWLIVSSLALSVGQITQELHLSRLVERPITLFVIGMLFAVALSHLSHLNFYSARTCSTEFLKVVIYYFLLVSNVNTVPRFRIFLIWLLGCIVIVASLGALQYHEVIDIPALTVLQEWDYDPETGDRLMVPRLRSTGLFNDPNDLSMILVVGITISASRLFSNRPGIFTPLLLGAIGLFAYDLLLTRSRGGLLALGTVSFVLLNARYGLKKSLCFAALALPAVPILLSGRQGNISAALDEGTGQSRVRIWAEGFGLFRQAPFFGIGQNEFSEELGPVAHNSYVHCFTELGFFGGTIFFSAFLYPILILYRARRVESFIVDDTIRRLRPYILSILAGYAVSMLSLSRSYIAPTYLVLGIASVWLHLADSRYLMRDACFNQQMAKRMIVASAMFLCTTYAFVRLMVRWSS